MKKTLAFLLAALCAASAFAQQSTLMERRRIATHRRLFTELGLIDGALTAAAYTAAVAKAATALQATVAAADTNAASSANAGKLRYRVAGTASFAEMSMQTATNAYGWVVLSSNVWSAE